MKKHKILVIEDDKTILEFLKKELEAQNYLVDLAENGKIAIELWEVSIYDLIIVDYRMPEMDGGEVIQRIRKKQPLTQIIILSGQARDEELKEAINYHVFAFISKPPDLPFLLQKVQEGLWNCDPLLLLLEKRAWEEPDTVVYLQGKEVVTTMQIYNEIRRGSPVGKQYWEDYRKNLTSLAMPENSIEQFLGIKGVV